MYFFGAGLAADGGPLCAGRVARAAAAAEAGGLDGLDDRLGGELAQALLERLIAAVGPVLLNVQRVHLAAAFEDDLLLLGEERADRVALRVQRIICGRLPCGVVVSRSPARRSAARAWRRSPAGRSCSREDAADGAGLHVAVTRLPAGADELHQRHAVAHADARAAFHDDVLAHGAQRRVHALLHLGAAAGHAAGAQPDADLDRLFCAAPPARRRRCGAAFSRARSASCRRNFSSTPRRSRPRGGRKCGRQCA